MSIKEGTGIDLSVAQEIIHLYKGKMEIDKSDGVLTFTIHFNSYPIFTNTRFKIDFLLDWMKKHR